MSNHSIYINGIASSFGEHLLCDEFLYSLNPKLKAYKSNVSSRYSVLPERYLIETANSDLSAASLYATQAPSQLAVAAAHKLLAQTGIAAEQIGLILADTVTPRQTIPAEAQRIGRLLGLKVPSFDIMSGPLAFARFFETLISWKAEHIPDYVLLVSTNSVSERINFATDNTALSFGDCAVAMLVSIKHPASTKVSKVDISPRAKCAFNSFTIPIFGNLGCQTSEALPSLSLDLDARYNPEAATTPYSECGYSFGSTFGVVLEKALISEHDKRRVKIACGCLEQSAAVEFELGVAI